MSAARSVTVAELEARWSPLSTNLVELAARALVRLLYVRALPLGIEGNKAHAADALNAIERLATSARAVEDLHKSQPSNDGGAT